MFVSQKLRKILGFIITNEEEIQNLFLYFDRAQ